MPSNHLILCHPLLLLPSIFPSIRVFSKESVLCMRWPKYWNFSFNWFPVVRTGWISLQSKGLSSLLKYHSSKALILQHSAVSIVQFSHPYVTTGKTIALTRWTFVDKVMSLLFNMLPRLVITFLPRSKCFLISWLQSPSAVIWETIKIKPATVSTSICHEVMGPDAMILASECWVLSQLFHGWYSSGIWLIFQPVPCIHLIPSSSWALFYQLFLYSSASLTSLVPYSSSSLYTLAQIWNWILIWFPHWNKSRKIISNFPKAKYYSYISNPIFLGLALPLDPGDDFSLKVSHFFLWCIFLVFSFLKWPFF